MAYTDKNKRIIYLVLGGVVFLLISLYVGLVLVRQPQNIVEKAAYPVCPGGEQCPMVGYPNHLLSCHPPDGTSPNDSLCNEKGRVETCGPAMTNYCCPAAGGSWTTDMTACPLPPTPIPTPPPPTANAPLTNINCPASNPLPVNFSWSAVVGATSYMLNIDDMSNGWNGCTTPNANDYCITVTSGTSHNLNLPINKSYRWGVAASNSANVQGPASAIVNFTIGASCTTPSNPPTVPPTAVPTPSPSPIPPACSNKPFITGRVSRGANNTTIVSCDYGGFIDCVSSEIIINGVKMSCPFTGQSGNSLNFNCNQTFSVDAQAVCSTHTNIEWPTSQSNCCSGSKLMSSWDIDLNGVVNIIDIGIVIDNYAKLPIANLRADVNSDGSVDIIDIGIIIDHYVL